jgi:D-serine dehydratase
LFSSETGSVVSAGGSLYFDIVVDVLGPLAKGWTTVLLRSGCYVTHDHGMYGAATPADQPSWRYGRFEPGLEVWARVVSRPEPDLVLLDAGRRDLSHDAGMPVPLAWSRPTDPRRRDLGGAHVPGLSDQHTFVAIPTDSELRVGDLVGLGISHPCTTFDRWPLMMLVDEDYTVADAIETLL